MLHHFRLVDKINETLFYEDNKLLKISIWIAALGDAGNIAISVYFSKNVTTVGAYKMA